MMLHEPDVGDHHVQNVFTNRLDVAAQLQLLAVQQHHTDFPQHLLHFPTFLGRGKFKCIILLLVWMMKQCLHVMNHIISAPYHDGRGDR